MSDAPPTTQYTRSAMTSEYWTSRQQNTPSFPAISQMTLLATHAQAREWTLEGRETRIEWTPRWSNCTHFEQYQDHRLQVQPRFIREPQNCSDCRPAPPWTTLYAVDSTIPVTKEAWAPYQHPHNYNTAEEARRFANRTTGCTCLPVRTGGATVNFFFRKHSKRLVVLDQYHQRSSGPATQQPLAVHLKQLMFGGRRRQ